MPLFNIELTKENFDECKWEDVIAAAAQKVCDKYTDLLFTKAQEASIAGDATCHEVFLVLAGISSLHLNPDNINEPFGAHIVMRGSRGMTSDDLSEHHYKVLEDVVPGVADSEMRARLADLLWVVKHRFPMAQAAVEAYLESAANLEDPAHWTSCADRIKRAVRLAAKLKNKSLLDKAIAHTEAVLDRLNGDEPYFLSAELMELLQGAKAGDFVKYAGLAGKAARRAENEEEFERARRYWETSARWHALAGDAEANRAALIERAETYVKQAETVRQRPGQFAPYGHAAGLLDFAIWALKNIGGPGTRERWEEIYKTMREYQKQSVNELIPLFDPLDATGIASEVIKRVEGKSLHDALATLVRLTSPSKVSLLRQQVDKYARSPLRHLFSTVMLNETGAVVARHPLHPVSEAEHIEAVAKAQMYQDATIYQRVRAEGLILPALKQIQYEHRIRIGDVLRIVEHSPFVPVGREFIYAQGLHAGLESDFITSTHLLIPQIEHSMRMILEEKGVATSKHDRKGQQNEFDLNTTLYMTEIKDVLGEDTVFDLQGVLVAHFGSNLRNRSAHGLMEHGEFYSAAAVYLWWLTWRLCLTPLL